MKLTRDASKEAINRGGGSMAKAAEALGVPFGTFKYHAVKHDLYLPNSAGKGNKYPRRGDSCRLPIEDIITGKVEYKASPNLLKKEANQGWFERR